MCVGRSCSKLHTKLFMFGTQLKLKIQTSHLRWSQNTSSNLTKISEEGWKAKNNRWIRMRGFLDDVKFLGWLQWRIMNNLWWWWEGGTWQPYGGPGACGVVIRCTVNGVKTWKWLWYDEGSEKHTKGWVGRRCSAALVKTV